MIYNIHIYVRRFYRDPIITNDTKFLMKLNKLVQLNVAFLGHDMNILNFSIIELIMELIEGISLQYNKLTDLSN